MALWRSRVRTPSGPPCFLAVRHQPGWYRGVLFVPELSGNVYEGDFLFISDGTEVHLGVSSIKTVVSRIVARLCVTKDNQMAKRKEHSLSDRLRELLDTLREALSPRQLAPVPIPARGEPRRR